VETLTSQIEWAEELLGPKNAFFVEAQKLTIWVQFHFA
jgi:hypothetical protein